MPGREIARSSSSNTLTLSWFWNAWPHSDRPHIVGSVERKRNNMFNCCSQGKCETRASIPNAPQRFTERSPRTIVWPHRRGRQDALVRTRLQRIKKQQQQHSNILHLDRPTRRMTWYTSGRTKPAEQHICSENPRHNVSRVAPKKERNMNAQNSAPSLQWTNPAPEAGTLSL